MRHLKSGRKLKRTSSHRKALLNNLATSLFEHKKVQTTEAKAKELRPFAESLITKAKHALAKEKQGLLPQGQTVDIHNRRIVAKNILNKGVIQELFDTIAPMVEERPGGYTRIIKTGTRRGDAGSMAIIELVDWSAPVDGAVSIKGKGSGGVVRKKQPKKVKEGKGETLAQTTEVEEAMPIEEVAGIDEVTTVVEPEIVADVLVEESVAPEVEVAEEAVTPVVENVAEVAPPVAKEVVTPLVKIAEEVALPVAEEAAAEKPADDTIEKPKDESEKKDK